METKRRRRLPRSQRVLAQLTIRLDCKLCGDVLYAINGSVGSAAELGAETTKTMQLLVEHYVLWHTDE